MGIAIISLGIWQFLRRHLYLVERQFILTPIVINNIDQVTITGGLEKNISQIPNRERTEKYCKQILKIQT
jgi:hypothetical protein